MINTRFAIIARIALFRHYRAITRRDHGDETAARSRGRIIARMVRLSVVLTCALVALAACKSDTSSSTSPSGSAGSASGSGAAPPEAKVTTIAVAGASDLAKAFEELGALWKAKSGITPVFQFGSSGLLARQIKEGAPVDLYAAANVQFVDDVIADGKCDAATKAMYGRGRLVIWSKDGGVAPPAKLEDLVDKRFTAIAIASPDHAPYGKAAKQAMEKLGIWPKVEGRMKYGEDVRKTLQFAETGNVDAAVVALSLSIVTKGGTSVPVPPELHDPIDQALVACGTGPKHAAAKAFGEYVGSAEGRAVMTKFGFVLPGEKTE
jgi:molybdate transport system substrate-binding protein